ncbi:hypothetical protein [Luteolibacter sp. LG18]|uniref:hypothetical protein n=1 Tax=Luteolibacter sp. LG18 TaxID=2819286 RepID=UPI002B2A6F0E|nr:hypothetical protein llg_38100 [Luteolibacter sp. LG18]
MNDPFVDLLESSLGVPDFDLGDAMRAELLAAAGAPVALPENVVPFVPADPDEQAAFDWLMGERPADLPLMEKLATRPAFLASVASQRSFLVDLRRAVRSAASPLPIAEQKAPRRGMRRVAAGVGAVAAGVALWMALQGSGIKPSGHSETMASATSSREVGKSGVVHHDPLPVRTDAFSIPFDPGVDASPESVVPTVAKTDVSAVVKPADDIEPVIEWKEAALAAAKDLFGVAAPSFVSGEVTEPAVMEEPALAFESHTKSLEGTAGEGLYAMASGGSSMRNDWYLWAGHDGNDFSVPEPGGCLPVMVASLLLWWRRRTA